MRVNTDDINLPEYWNEEYAKEYGTDKKRVDPERANYLLGAIKRWISTNGGQQPYFADFGCGGGELIRWLQYEMPQFEKIGVDIAPEAIRQAQADKQKIQFKVANLNEDAGDISQGSVNVAFMGETLEHLKKPEEALDKVFNTLKLGGYLVLSVPCKTYNASPEHNHIFDVWDIMRIASKYGSLEHMDVVNGGITLICIIKKGSNE